MEADLYHEPARHGWLPNSPGRVVTALGLEDHVIDLSERPSSKDNIKANMSPVGTWSPKPESGLAGCGGASPPPPPPPLTSLATSFGFYPFPNPHRLPLNLLPPLPHRPAALFIPNLTNPPRYLNYTSDFNPFGLIPVARDPLKPRSAQRCQGEAETNSFFFRE